MNFDEQRIEPEETEVAVFPELRPEGMNSPLTVTIGIKK